MQSQWLRLRWWRSFFFGMSVLGWGGMFVGRVLLSGDREIVLGGAVAGLAGAAIGLVLGLFERQARKAFERATEPR